MDRKSKILFSIFLLLIIGSVFLTYWQYIYRGNITFFTDPNNVPDGLQVTENILHI